MDGTLVPVGGESTLTGDQFLEPLSTIKRTTSSADLLGQDFRGDDLVQLLQIRSMEVDLLVEVLGQEGLEE